MLGPQQLLKMLKILFTRPLTMRYILIRGRLFGLELRLMLKTLYTKRLSQAFGMLTYTRFVKCSRARVKSLKALGRIDLVMTT